jgi:hypothetical protein
MSKGSIIVSNVVPLTSCSRWYQNGSLLIILDGSIIVYLLRGPWFSKNRGLCYYRCTEDRYSEHSRKGDSNSDV